MGFLVLVSDIINFSFQILNVLNILFSRALIIARFSWLVKRFMVWYN